MFYLNNYVLWLSLCVYQTSLFNVLCKFKKKILRIVMSLGTPDKSPVPL